MSADNENKELKEKDITLLKDRNGREIRLSNDLAIALQDRSAAEGFAIEALPEDFNPMQTQVGEYVKEVRDEMRNLIETAVDGLDADSPHVTLLRQQAVNLTTSDDEEKLAENLKKAGEALLKKVKEEVKGEAKDGNDYLFTEGKPGFVETITENDFKSDMTDAVVERQVQRLQRRVDLEYSPAQLHELKDGVVAADTAVNDAKEEVDDAQTAFVAAVGGEGADHEAALRAERSARLGRGESADGGNIAIAKKALDDAKKDLEDRKKDLKTAEEKEKRFPDQKKYLEQKRDALKSWQVLLKINQQLASNNHFTLLAMNNLMACAEAEYLFNLGPSPRGSAGVRLSASGASCPFTGDQLAIISQYQQHFKNMHEDHFSQRKALVGSLGASLGFNVPYGFMYMEKNGQFGFHWSGPRSPEASDAKEVVSGLHKTGLTDIKANSDSTEFLEGFAREAILQGLAFKVTPNFIKGTQELLDVDQKLAATYNPIGEAIREAQKDKDIDKKDVVAVYTRALQSDHFKSSTKSLNAFIETMGADRFKSVLDHLVTVADVASLKLLALRVFKQSGYQAQFKSAFTALSGERPKVAAKLFTDLANDPIMTPHRWRHMDTSIIGPNSAEALLSMMITAGLHDNVVKEIFGEEGKLIGKITGDDAHIEASSHVSFLLHRLFEFDSGTRSLTVSSRGKAMVCIEKMVEAMFKEVLATVNVSDITGFDGLPVAEQALIKHEKARNAMNTRLAKLNKGLQENWSGSTKPVDLMMESVTRSMVETANAISIRELGPEAASALNTNMTAEFRRQVAPVGASTMRMRTGASPVSPSAPPASAAPGIGAR